MGPGYGLVLPLQGSELWASMLKVVLNDVITSL